RLDVSSSPVTAASPPCPVRHVPSPSCAHSAVVNLDRVDEYFGYPDRGVRAHVPDEGPAVRDPRGEWRRGSLAAVGHGAPGLAALGSGWRRAGRGRRELVVARG